MSSAKKKQKKRAGIQPHKATATVIPVLNGPLRPNIMSQGSQASNDGLGGNEDGGKQREKKGKVADNGSSSCPFSCA